MFETVELQEVPTDKSFDEHAYLAANPDVAAAVASGTLRSGSAHFRKFGRAKADDSSGRSPALQPMRWSR